MASPDQRDVWIKITKRSVPDWHELGCRTRIGPEPGQWWVSVGWLLARALVDADLVEESKMARRRADEVNRWVVIVVLGAEIWSEEFASSDAAEACRRHFEGVEGAKIEVIEDVAG